MIMMINNNNSSSTFSMSSSSIIDTTSAIDSSCGPLVSANRSQRCGVCRGCQSRPCGNCTFCADSPQFGGPGVKKQSCIERRCLRVLENRLQRDAPSFRARIGCGRCDECAMPDCHACLVCLDRRFFDNRYMRNAMCAKKRCNHATAVDMQSIDTPSNVDHHSSSTVLYPISQNTPSTSDVMLLNREFHQRQLLKRQTDHQFVDTSSSIPPRTSKQIRASSIHNTSSSMLVPFANSSTLSSSIDDDQHLLLLYSNGDASHRTNINEQASSNRIDIINASFNDPFLPPSFAPGKNAVVLQPL